MNWKVTAMALFLTACPTFAQQSGTTTECEKQLDKLVCKTEQTPPTALEAINKALADRRAKAEARREQNAQNVQQSPQVSPEAIKELLAEEKKDRNAKDTVDFIYCRQNPKNTMTDSDGKTKTCADVLEYTKAFCSVNPDAERCTLAKSKAEVEKAFAALLSQYNSDNHRNRSWEQSYYGESFAKLTKWGCMSFPDMILPERDGAAHPCPNAPEAPSVQAGVPQPK